MVAGRKRAAKKADPVQAKRRSSGRKPTGESKDVIVAVRSFRKIGGVDHYQVEWSSDSRKDSWEPAKDVKKVARSLVEEYEASVAEDDREYEVERVVDRKKSGKDNVKYLVKWVGYSSEENTWEPSDSIPANKIKEFENEFGTLGDKKKAKVAATDAVSMIKNRKTVNNVLHYEVKFVGQTATKWMPIYEISDVEAVKEWEESQYDPNSNTKIDSEVEYTVEKIISKRGYGKKTEYRVKWIGYPSSKNTWEPLENLAGSMKLVKAFDKIAAEREEKVANTDYEIQKIVSEKLYRNKPVYLVRWKGFSPSSDTWEPAEQFKDAPEALTDWEEEKKKRDIRGIERKKKRDEKREQRKLEKAEAKKKAAEEKPAEAPVENGEAEEPKEETATEEAPAE